MKNTRKAVSFLLAMMMLICSISGVFAADNGKITISSTAPDQTYSIYRMFDLSYSSGAYSYHVRDSWAAFVAQEGVKDVYFSTDAQGYVTIIDNSADMAPLSTLAINYAIDNSIQPDEAITATTNSVVFDNLPLGYYLVKSTVGALCALTTTAPEGKINAKNALPSAVKTVYGDNSKTWGDTNDADILQTIYYKTEITVQKGALNYVLHDIMDTTNIILDTQSVKVWKNPSDVSVFPPIAEAQLVENTDYTLTFTPADGHTFDVALTKSFLDNITASTTVLVTYEAKLAEGVLPGTYYTNKTWLSYGENEDMKTPDSGTATYTWEFKVFKHNPDNQPLHSAKFLLSKEENGTTLYAILTSDANNNTASNANNKYIMQSWTSEKTSATEIETPINGFIEVKGLDSDTYALEETAAPDGYNRIAQPIKFKITNQGAVTDLNGTTLQDRTIKVENRTGTELPSTGGIGTTIFYALGTVLVLGAAVLLITRKRLGLNK